jgi:hypothetical protein
MFPKRSNRTAPPAAGFSAMIAGLSDTHPRLGNLHKAMHATVSEYKFAHDAIDRIGGDKTLTDGARLVRQASVVRSKMAPALKALETAKNATAAGRKNVEAELRKHISFDGATFAVIG